MSKIDRSNKRKKTITRKFRIRQEWDNVLQKEALRQGVSVNVLLNKMLRKYSLFSRWTERNININLSQQTLRELLGTVKIEKIAEAEAKSGKLYAINIINSMGLPMDYDSFVYLITEYLGRDFARWFQCFYHTQNNKDIFHLQHNFSRNWSIFLENYIIAFLAVIVDMNVKTRIYDYAITLEVNLPRTKNE